MIEDKDTFMFHFPLEICTKYVTSLSLSTHCPYIGSSFVFLRKENRQQMVVIRLRAAQRNSQRNEILSFVMHIIILAKTCVFCPDLGRRTDPRLHRAQGALFSLRFPLEMWK